MSEEEGEVVNRVEVRNGGNNVCGDPKTELQNKIILDVGAGHGSSSVLLNRGGTLVISLDHNLKKLKKGVKEKKISRGHAVLADARYLPFKDDSLDLVSSRYFMHCVTAHVRYLEEMKRIMKPEGEILIVDLCAPVPEVREFVEMCHFKEPPPLLCCGILTKDELLYQLTRLGIEVGTIKWFAAKKKVSGRKLNSYVQEEMMRNPAIKEHINIRKGKRNFYVHLPVVAINGEKRT